MKNLARFCSLTRRACIRDAGSSTANRSARMGVRRAAHPIIKTRLTMEVSRHVPDSTEAWTLTQLRDFYFSRLTGIRATMRHAGGSSARQKARIICMWILSSCGRAGRARKCHPGGASGSVYRATNGRFQEWRATECERPSASRKWP